MVRRLEDKVAIVTGAAQGAGWGAAQALARDGARVTLVGRTAAKLERAAAELATIGAETFVAPGDVTDRGAMNRVVLDTLARFGRIDTLVCAAQSPEVRSGALLDIGEAVIEELWQSGPVATLMLMRSCHPHMRAAGGGSIVTVASGALRVPGNYGVYAACKAAILTMSQAAAVEWGPDNIRVNTIVPFVQSPALEAELSEDVQAAVAASLPLRRIGRPEDIGSVVAFLASDDASYLTGSMLNLDGGSWYSSRL